MSVRLLSAAVVVLSSLAFSAAADAPSGVSAQATSASAQANNDDDPDKIICKTSKKTGTRLAKRSAKICKTKAEWDRIDLENQLMNQDMQRQLGASGPKG